MMFAPWPPISPSLGGGTSVGSGNVVGAPGSTASAATASALIQRQTLRGSSSIGQEERAGQPVAHALWAARVAAATAATTASAVALFCNQRAGVWQRRPSRRRDVRVAAAARPAKHDSNTQERPEHEDNTQERRRFKTKKELQAEIGRVVEQLREVDKLNGALPYAMQTASAPAGLRAVDELEQLAKYEPLKGSAPSKGRTMINALQATLEGVPVELQRKALDESFKQLSSGEDAGLDASDFSAVAEHLKRCLREASDRLADGDDLRYTWPPKPSATDVSPVAQAVRVPAIASLLEASREAEQLGLSNLAPLSGSKVLARANKLEDIVPSLEDAVLLGDAGVQITGLADVPALVRPGDAMLLPWVELNDDAWTNLRMEVQDAVDRGAVAVVFHGAPSDLQKSSFEDAAGPLLECAGLELVAALPQASSALAREFFGGDKMSSQVSTVAIVGGNAIEVHTASWLLYTVLERGNSSRRGAALLTPRRSWIGGGSVDVRGVASSPSDSHPRPLTPCIVQELFAESCNASVATVVAEVAPGGQRADAFDGMSFDLIIDLGQGSDQPTDEGWQRLRGQLLQNAAAGSVVAAASDTLQGDFDLVPPQPMEFTPKKLDTSEELNMRGVRPEGSARDFLSKAAGWQPHTQYQFSPLKEVVDAARRESKLEAEGQEEQDELFREMVAAFQAMREAAQPGDFTYEDDTSSTSGARLVGRVLQSTRSSGMCLEFTAPGCGTGALALPLYGLPAARGAVAAVAAACALERGQGVDANAILKRVLESMRGATAPPGSVEVLTATWPPRVVAIYHDASTPGEIRRVLKCVREWAAVGAEETEGTKITAVLGCQGDMRRGDRAKCGWALADYCDCAVLTSDHPRSEPPMQIIEDVLEAIRARTQPSLSTHGFGGLDDPPGTRLAALSEVQVVSDRTDALKLAITSCVSDPLDGPPGIAVVFGGAVGFQEVAGADGVTTQWLHNDRRIIMEILEASERLSIWGQPSDDGTEEANIAAEKVAKRINVARVPWFVGRRSDDGWKGGAVSGARKKSGTAIRFPGQSLHWAHAIDLKSDGTPATRQL